jgi:hypothetical protein
VTSLSLGSYCVDGLCLSSFGHGLLDKAGFLDTICCRGLDKVMLDYRLNIENPDGFTHWSMGQYCCLISPSIPPNRPPHSPRVVRLLESNLADDLMTCSRSRSLVKLIESASTVRPSQTTQPSLGRGPRETALPS